MSVTLFTPTYAEDYDRFLLLRESIEQCGIAFGHVAVVHHEDMDRFRSCPFRRDLTIVSTRDVLPAAIEKRRVAFLEGRSTPRWLRRFVGRPMQGWYAQQFVKLAAPAVVADDLIVCIDSDTLFLRNMTAGDFVDSNTGLPYLYETTDDMDAEMAEWLGRSMRFLGVRPTHQPISRFTHSPTILRRDVLLDLHRTIEQRHHRPWWQAFNPYDSIMEYTTYGVYAKYIDREARMTAGPPKDSLYFWWPEQVNALADRLPDLLKTTSAKILTVQSNVGLGVDRYAGILRPFWDADEEASTATFAGPAS